MYSSPTALERAFELAKSGKYSSVAEIKKQLKAERYTLEQITGKSLAKQLAALIIQNGGKSAQPDANSTGGEPAPQPR